MSNLHDRLIAAHYLLSREIGRERRTLRPDATRLSRLKKQRLAIKDRLHRHIPSSTKAFRFVREILVRLRRVHA